MIYSERLKKLRNEKNLNQDIVANIINIERGTFSEYENELKIIPIKHLNTLCEFYNVSLDYIFGFTNIKLYENCFKNFNTEKTKRRLKELRKELKINQETLAQLIGTAKTTISGYERGARIIATPFLYAICKKYNISADYLLGKTNDPKYIKTSKID